MHRLLMFGFAAGVWALSLSGAIAQDSYPTRPIRIIVPYPPGGINDFAARSFSTGLSEALKVPMVVDNRGGAGGIVGMRLVAAAAPDGYTFVVASSGAFVIKQILLKNPPYDVLRDFEPVIHVGDTPHIVVARPSFPARSIKELIAFAKAAREPLTYGSSGIGSSNQLATEQFAQMTGTKFLQVVYKGAGPAIIDVIGGQISVMFATMPSALPQVNAGKLRALATTGAKRFPSTPDVPTVIEEGVPGYTAIGWTGMLAPARTPKAIVARVASEVDKILQTATTRKYFLSQGAEAVGGTPAEFGAYIREELATLKKVADQSGLSGTVTD